MNEPDFVHVGYMTLEGTMFRFRHEHENRECDCIWLYARAGQLATRETDR